MSAIGSTLVRATASSLSRIITHAAKLAPRLVNSRSCSCPASSSLVLGRRPFSSSPAARQDHGLGEDPSKELPPHLRRVQKKAVVEEVPELSAEEQQVERLRAVFSETGRSPRDAEIPDDMLVQPYLPKDPRPRSPIPFGSIKSMREMDDLQRTHHLVMVKISLGRQSDPHSYPIVRVISKEEVAKQEAADKLKRREQDRATAAARKPSSLGVNSGLRNQAAPKEIEATWVMSDHDMGHRLAQVRRFLEDAFRVTVTFRPKRTGKKLKVSQDQKDEQIAKAWDQLSDIAERYEADKVNGESVTMYVEPNKQVRKHVGEAEKEKHKQEVLKKEAELERKAKRAEREKATAKPKWKPGQPIPTAPELEGKK